MCDSENMKNQILPGFESLGLGDWTSLPGTNNNNEPPEDKVSIMKFAKDMKQRIGLFRRRHTDGAIQDTLNKPSKDKSVRPSPLIALQWKDNIDNLLHDKYGVALFRAFLRLEYAEENLEFWLACENFRKVKPSKISQKAQQIYGEFVAVQAPKEINLDSQTRNITITNLQSPNRHSFDQAQKRVLHILEDCYQRFLKSELYVELLHSESK